MRLQLIGVDGYPTVVKQQPLLNGKVSESARFIQGLTLSINGSFCYLLAAGVNVYGVSVESSAHCLVGLAVHPALPKMISQDPAQFGWQQK